MGLSGAALAAQVVATDYGTDRPAGAVFWFLLGCLLLWLVYRHHSRAAWGFVIVTSLMGGVIYSLSALVDARSAFLAPAFLAQAVPLMSKQVRRHVHTET